MYCNKCGAQLKEDSVFCENCGTKLNETILAKLAQKHEPQVDCAAVVKSEKSKKPIIIVCIVSAVVIMAVIVLFMAKLLSKRAVVGDDGGIMGIGGNTNPDGLYIPLERTYLNDIDEWKTKDLDEFIKEMLDEEYDDESKAYNYMMQLKDDCFEMYGLGYDDKKKQKADTGYIIPDEAVWLRTVSGSYSEKSDGFHFDYVSDKFVDKNGNIVKENAIEKDSDKVVDNINYKNSIGYYDKAFGLRSVTCHFSERYRSDPMSTKFIKTPVMFYSNYNDGQNDGKLRQSYLNYDNGVLAFPIRDTELVGKYKKGKDFEIESSCWIINQCKTPHTTDLETLTISFSEGEWEFATEDGTMISNGEYEESDIIPGLISVYITENSEIYEITDEGSVKAGDDFFDEIVNNRLDQPYLIYITEDGEVTYPYMIRVAEVEE